MAHNNMHLASRALQLENLHELLSCAEAARFRRLSKAMYHLGVLSTKTTLGERVRERMMMCSEVKDWLKRAIIPACCWRKTKTTLERVPRKV